MNRLEQIYNTLFDERGVYDGDRYSDILPWSFSSSQVKLQDLPVLLKTWAGSAIATYERKGAIPQGCLGFTYLSNHERNWYVIVIDMNMGIESMQHYGDDAGSAWFDYLKAVTERENEFDLADILDSVVAVAQG